MFIVNKHYLVSAFIFFYIIPETFARPTLEPHETYNSKKAQKLPSSIGLIIVGSSHYKFNFEVADTNYSRRIGLMHRSSMASNSGMLFNFKSDRVISMWMRNTFLPLDILFLSKNGAVETIFKGAVPHSEISISSEKPVRAALELVAGTVDKLKIEIGNKISHSMFE